MEVGLPFMSCRIFPTHFAGGGFFFPRSKVRSEHPVLVLLNTFDDISNIGRPTMTIDVLLMQEILHHLTGFFPLFAGFYTCQVVSLLSSINTVENYTWKGQWRNATPASLGLSSPCKKNVFFCSPECKSPLRKVQSFSRF